MQLKLDSCKQQGKTEKATSGIFWCKHSDVCNSQMSWGANSNVCLQSPAYSKPVGGQKEQK